MSTKAEEEVIVAARSVLKTLQLLRDDPIQQTSTIKGLNLRDWANLRRLEVVLSELDEERGGKKVG